jgi:hypothetical protein
VTITASSVGGLVETELSELADERVLKHIRSLLVPPRSLSRQWDYGPPNTDYPCWVALVHGQSDTGIAYCEFGFGPRSPWGLLSFGEGHRSMGMDSGWYRSFLDAYFESIASTDLPIWRVFECSGSAYPGVPLTSESDWQTTWREIERLRAAHPDRRFHCDQSIYPRRL